MHKPDVVHLTHFPTPLGPMTIASTERGVVASSLPGSARECVRRWLDRRLPRAEIMEGTGRNAPYVQAVRQYLAGRSRKLDVPLDLRGTEFQKKVWTMLRRVPYGATVGYGELAERAGYPRAARACGTAHANNPLPLFVPCHRTIAGDGGIGGFGGRLDLKRKLLELESRRGRGPEAGVRGRRPAR